MCCSGQSCPCNCPFKDQRDFTSLGFYFLKNSSLQNCLNLLTLKPFQFSVTFFDPKEILKELWRTFMLFYKWSKCIIHYIQSFLKPRNIFVWETDWNVKAFPQPWSQFTYIVEKSSLDILLNIVFWVPQNKEVIHISKFTRICELFKYPLYAQRQIIIYFKCDFLTCFRNIYFFQ